MFSSSVRAAIGASARWVALGMGVAVGMGAADLGAAEPWLRVHDSEHCSVPASALAASILEATLGTPDRLFAVDVSISDGPPTTARVRLALGSRGIGVKELEAPTCAEVLDAITTVVALALSSESDARELGAPPEDSTSREASASPGGAASLGDAASPESTRRAPAPIADALAAHDELGRDTRGWRLLLGVGADRGSLSEPTAVVQAGAAASLGRGEVRALVSYGVPTVREEVSDVFSSVHADFGALALDYCRALDAERWVSACAGLELGLRRYSRVEQAAEEARIERERFEASTSVLAGLAFVYRDATVQPRLDVMSGRALLGAPAEAPLLGFRAALGAAVQF
jgi:hypothetical protein